MLLAEFTKLFLSLIEPLQSAEDIEEAFINISNLSLLTSKGETTRVGYKMEGDKKVRFTKKSNEVI